MSMRLTRPLGIGIAAVLTGWAAPYSASAESKLTDFNGVWSGTGTDSNPPWHPFSHPTSCQTMVQAHPSSMTSTTECKGQGLHKVIHLSIRLDGDEIKGKLSQITSVPGSDPSKLHGPVSGRRVDDMASFQVQIQELVGVSATVDLKRLSPSSYSMQVTATGLGFINFTLMDVVFNKTPPR